MKNKRGIPQNLFIYLVIYYFSMGISKYVQVLWFAKNDNLINYSLSYSSMAIFGSLSFIISTFISGWSIKKILKTFVPIYALGMSLRIFSGSAIVAIISGGVAGIGASICALAIRYWIFYLVDKKEENNKSKIISTRYIIMQVSLMLATFVAGQLLYIVKIENSYIYLLILSAIMILMLTAFKDIPNENNVITQSSRKKFQLPDSKSKAITLYVSVVLMGISTSLLEPLLPVIIKDVGYNLSISTTIFTAYGLFKIASIFIFKMEFFYKNSSITFLLLEVISGGVVLLIGLTGVDKNILLLLLIMVGVETAGFFVLKEMMEYTMFPKSEMLLYLGISQSAFLFGDSLGSIFGAMIYEKTGYNQLILYFGLFTVVSSSIYFMLYVIFKKNNINVVQD